MRGKFDFLALAVILDLREKLPPHFVLNSHHFFSIHHTDGELSRSAKNLVFGFFGFLLVGAEGFEPSTFCSRSKRATRLRYAPT